MPSEKTRSKEDTWRPEELEKSLKEIRDDKRDRRKHGDRDDKEKEDYRRRGEDANGEDGRDKHRPRRQYDSQDGKDRRSRVKDDDTRPRHRAAEDEDRQRRHDDRRKKDEETDDRQRRKKDERKKKEGEGERDRRGERRDEDDVRRRRDRDDEGRRRDRDDEGRRHHRDSEGRQYRRRDGDEENRQRNQDENNYSDQEKRRPHRDQDNERRRHRGNDSKDPDERKHHQDREDSERTGHRDRNGDVSSKHRSEKKDERSHRDDSGSKERSKRSKDEQHSLVTKDKERRSKHMKEPKQDDSRRKPADRRERRREEKGDQDRRRDRENKKDDREIRRDDKDRRKDRVEDRRRNSPDEVKVEGGVSSKSLTRESSNQQTDDYEDDFEDYEEDFEEDEEDTGLAKEADLGDYTEFFHRRMLAQQKHWDPEYAPQTEVDEVLKALDAENERLLSESRRSNWSDSTELSDERFKSSGPVTTQQRTFINFVSAKQRAITDQTSSKTRRRGRDLLQLIELDVATYDMFDLPPVSEYDLYMRNYGRSDTRQVCIQTSEDNIERDIQTEEIEYRERWSQHPPEDSIACGLGDGETEQEELSIKKLVTDNSSKLSTFIRTAGQAIAALLEEELANEGGEDSNRSQSNISISQGYTQLASLSFLQGRHVQQVCFAGSHPNTLLTVYSPCQQPGINQRTDELGFVCVWNITEPSSPQKVLVCDSQPTSCCFSPSNASLVFAGIVDGSLVLWDLREPSSMHAPVRLEEREFFMRYPTYNTAGVLEEENHQSCVVTVTHTISSTDSKGSKSAANDSASGVSFQLVSVDELATVNLWVVAELSSADLAGSQSDLGLSPGGRVKLIKSSSILLHSPIRDVRLNTALKVTCLALSPMDPNKFIVGTDAGCIVHGVRFGSTALPRAYVGTTDAPVEITSLDFSPFCKPCFLAGCADGTVRLYHTMADKPLMSWSAVGPRCEVIRVMWSPSRPAVFYILYKDSTLVVYDLVENDSVPASVDQLSGGRPVTMCLSPDHNSRGSGEPIRQPQLVFTLDTGKIEIHNVVKTVVEQQPFEDDFLSSYIDRF